MNSIISPKVDKTDNKPSTSYSSSISNDSSKLTGRRTALIPPNNLKNDPDEEPRISKMAKEDGEEEDPNYSNEHPEEFISGQWEIDNIQYCNFNPVTSRLNDSLSINTIDPKRMKNGSAYRNLCDKDTSDYKCFRDERKEVYKIGDFVYLELDAAYPYIIGKIESFKMKKGAQMTVKVARLYRREDLITDSQSLLEAERREVGIVESNEDVRVRELFPSDAHLTQSVAVLKGHCQIVHLAIKNALIDGNLKRDMFFYCVSYSPDTGRLSACHPEIREGQKYQAVCPELNDSVIGDEPDRDQLVYKPGNMCAETEDTVVKYARGYRSLALLENTQINELERTAFQGDRVKIDALDCLTRCGYVASDAVKQMKEDDKVFLAHAQFLSADDTKKFVKGLRNYGKNFPKIVKEYLPSFSRDSLVFYYYLWKKSGEAFKPKKVNGTVSKKALFPQTKRTTRSGNMEPALVDYDSVSEDEDLERESGHACHHCYSLESRDWHHSGLVSQLLCTMCRHHYKRYGTMREVERPKDVPPSLIREDTLNGSEEGDEGVKTRASNRRDRLKTPNDDDRTPIKNGIDPDGERRSTPQRSVKSHKRTYHPSTSSTEEALTPKKHKEHKSHKLKPIHQLALTNKLKTEKQESVDSDDQQTCQKTTSNEDPMENSPKKRLDSMNDEMADVSESDSVEIKDDHRLKKYPECILIRNEKDHIDLACARTQFYFKCEDEKKWEERKKELAEAKQKQKREAQAKNQAELDKQKIIEQELQQARQLQAVAAQNIPMQQMVRAPQDLMHHQMRLPSMPPNSMLRPALPPLTPELMALAATRPEILQVLAMQHQQAQAQAQQQQPRPPPPTQQQQQMMMQLFGNPNGMPPNLNHAALMHAQNPAVSSALLYQMQQNQAVAQQQHQARMLEEQKRQQLEQREREQRQSLQQQLQNQQHLQNQQMQNQQNQQFMELLAMGFNPQQLLAAASGFPMGGNMQAGMPQNVPTSQQQQQALNPAAVQMDQITQLIRASSQQNPNAAAQQQNHELMQVLNMMKQQEQQRNQTK